MIAFETDVRIGRRIEEVFAYVSDPLNFPRWNSAVQAVRTTSAGQSGVASTYSMERELPSGRAVNELEVVASDVLDGPPSSCQGRPVKSCEPRVRRTWRLGRLTLSSQHRSNRVALDVVRVRELTRTGFDPNRSHSLRSAQWVTSHLAGYRGGRGCAGANDPGLSAESS